MEQAIGDVMDLTRKGGVRKQPRAESHVKVALGPSALSLRQQRDLCLCAFHSSCERRACYELPQLHDLSTRIHEIHERANAASAIDTAPV